jgi:hypothetical protein
MNGTGLTPSSVGPTLRLAQAWQPFSPPVQPAGIGPSGRRDMQSEQTAWYCARTKPKHEHIAAANVRKHLGLEVFHPQLRVERATRRGVVRVVEPLFPCYIFVHCVMVDSLNEIRHTDGISSLVHFGIGFPGAGPGDRGTAGMFCGGRADDDSGSSFARGRGGGGGRGICGDARVCIARHAGTAAGTGVARCFGRPHAGGSGPEFSWCWSGIPWRSGCRHWRQPIDAVDGLGCRGGLKNQIFRSGFRRQRATIGRERPPLLQVRSFTPLSRFFEAEACGDDLRIMILMIRLRPVAGFQVRLFSYSPIRKRVTSDLTFLCLHEIRSYKFSPMGKLLPPIGPGFPAGSARWI